MKTILVTGGCGYVGAVLVPKLIAAGHDVRVLDAMVFGNTLEPHPMLEVIEGDIRNTGLLWRVLQDVQVVIHLAAVTDEASFQLDPQFGKSINYDAFELLVSTAKRRGVGRFIYASEATTTDPLPSYAFCKVACEPILQHYQSMSFTTVTLRAVELCGRSPRQRLDLLINNLTSSAVNTGTMTVVGGNHPGPSLHVQDMADLCARLVDETEDRVAGQVFTASGNEYTQADLAGIARTIVEREMPDLSPLKIDLKPAMAPSYHVSNSELMRALDWSPQYTVADAVLELCLAFKLGKIRANDPQHYNAKTLESYAVRR